MFLTLLHKKYSVLNWLTLQKKLSILALVESIESRYYLSTKPINRIYIFHLLTFVGLYKFFNVNAFGVVKPRFIVPAVTSDQENFPVVTAGC